MQPALDLHNLQDASLHCIFKQQGFYEKLCRDASCLLSLPFLFVYFLSYHPYLVLQFLVAFLYLFV